MIKSYDMKNAVKINEAQLRKVVAESVKKVLKESAAERESYYNLKKSIRCFLNMLESEYDVNSEDVKTVIDILYNAENVIDNFATHPDFGWPVKKWGGKDYEGVYENKALK